MTNKDVEILLRFITRTEMYTMKDESLAIIAFVQGYETGRRGRCHFSTQLSEVLENEFKFKRKSTGWNGQIVEFGEKNNLNWETSFKKIALMVLSKYFQGKSKKNFEETIRTVIQVKIDQIEIVRFENRDWVLNRFGERWINKWIGLVDLNEKWFREIWTDDQMEVISKINNEIIKIENKQQKEIIAPKELIDLANKFKMTVKVDA